MAPRILNFGTRFEVSGQLHVPAALPSGKRAPDTRRIGGWVGSGNGLGTLVKRKNSQLPPGFEPQSSDRPALS